MFSLYGYEETIRNVYRVAHPFINGRVIQGSDDLRTCYLDFLQDHQPYMPINRSDDVFISDPEIENGLVAAYGHNATLNDLKQSEIIGEPYSDEDKTNKTALAREALEEFRNIDDTLCAVFDLTIHSIVIRPSNRPQGRASHGGSSSAAMGTIWLAMGPSITKADVVEMLLHELTHHLLFIDERNHAHFDYDLIARKENQGFSAILNLIRPVDKVFHSIVVAAELILGRRRFLPHAESLSVHPPTAKMLADVLTAQASLAGSNSARFVLKPRACEILDQCAVACGPSPQTQVPNLSLQTYYA